MSVPAQQESPLLTTHMIREEYARSGFAQQLDQTAKTFDGISIAAFRVLDTIERRDNAQLEIQENYVGAGLLNIARFAYKYGGVIGHDIQSLIMSIPLAKQAASSEINFQQEQRRLDGQFNIIKLDASTYGFSTFDTTDPDMKKQVERLAHGAASLAMNVSRTQDRIGHFLDQLEEYETARVGPSVYNHMNSFCDALLRSARLNSLETREGQRFLFNRMVGNRESNEDGRSFPLGRIEGEFTKMRANAANQERWPERPDNLEEMKPQTDVVAAVSAAPTSRSALKHIHSTAVTAELPTDADTDDSDTDSGLTAEVSSSLPLFQNKEHTPEVDGMEYSSPNRERQREIESPWRPSPEKEQEIDWPELEM